MSISSISSISDLYLVKLKQMCLCLLPLQNYYQNKLKLAIIGQSLFGQEVYTNLRKQGHKVVGVFTVPDKDGKVDPLGEFIRFSLHVGSVFLFELCTIRLCVLSCLSGQLLSYYCYHIPMESHQSL